MIEKKGGVLLQIQENSEVTKITMYATETMKHSLNHEGNSLGVLVHVTTSEVNDVYLFKASLILINAWKYKRIVQYPLDNV